ncbi:hypothetical protein CVT25_008479 [Psilocybe cyanescens]|uniref:Uncharacterized protein n=1 Tax=Psilocybe cyanescens TaxID=93625 RepID=A0A409XRQ0_PSICY|nr:hypothetical protein CVT25_008479 [Psilocybe cyanescens]
MPPSSKTTPTSSASVFWPKGSTTSSVCYGRLKAAICVAGVLEVTGLSCGGDPVLVGTCEFDNDERRSSPIPTSLKLWLLGRGSDTKFSFVLYYRHTPPTLRFYVVDLPQLSPLPTSTKANSYIALAHYDFTRSQPRDMDQALNETVLNQVRAVAII